jgi:hypothetical protein
MTLVMLSVMTINFISSSSSSSSGWGVKRTAKALCQVESFSIERLHPHSIGRSEQCHHLSRQEMLRAGKRQARARHDDRRSTSGKPGAIADRQPESQKNTRCVITSEESGNLSLVILIEHLSARMPAWRLCGGS